jgi:hypothetical protein
MMGIVPDVRCWKVVHVRDGIESVYLVGATSRRSAQGEIKDLRGYQKGDGWSISEFKPDSPYFLYAINRTTGAMTPANSMGAESMCITCLGNVSGG